MVGTEHNHSLSSTSNSSETSFDYDEYAYYLFDLNERIRFIDSILLMPLVVTFGVFGNVLSIIGWRQSSVRSSSNNYLIALAVADALYLLFSLSLTFHHVDWSLEYNDYYTAYQFLIGMPATNLCSNIAVWLIVVYSIERYIAVRHPLKQKASACSTLYIILTVLLTNIAVALPGLKFSFSL